ncbi:D,D-heptose 1,7-bisphosphate phosphatase [Bryobacterales bacterium F-183]|nr:D,D-heptose 1,7-bisphosphate phosphatase [Bryobacterales bacterium F-183]
MFFDRDGTLMREVGYCSDPAHVEILPGAAEAVKWLRGAGFAIVVVTNQSGIGRGFYTDAQFQAVHEEFLRQLGEPVDATYYAPEHPEVEPSRRKPSPAMLLEAAAELDLDLAESFIVGDREGDVGAGHNAGCRASILVLSGITDRTAETAADFVAEGPREAALWILDQREARNAASLA